MSKIQRVILEQGTINTLQERIELVKRFNKYEERIDKISGVNLVMKSTPLSGKESDENRFTSDSEIVELLDGYIDSFLDTLEKPYMYSFEDITVFNCCMKSKYIIYIEFDLDKHLGEIVEKVDNFERFLDD